MAKQLQRYFSFISGITANQALVAVLKQVFLYLNVNFSVTDIKLFIYCDLLNIKTNCSGDMQIAVIYSTSLDLENTMNLVVFALSVFMDKNGIVCINMHLTLKHERAAALT